MDTSQKSMLLAEGTSSEAGTLRQTLDLVYTWTSRQISARYEQSLLGWLWAVAQPAAQVAIFSLIFTRIIPVDTGGIPYVLFSFVAIAPWTFLASALTDMTSSIVDNMMLVSKIYFQREVLPVSAMLARLIDFGVATFVTIILVVVYGVPLHLERLLLFPVIFAIQICLITGIGLGCAAANTFLRDVRPLLVLILQVWFYASPILYPVDRVPPDLRTFYALNPAVGIIEGYRAVWLNTGIRWEYIGTAALMAFLALAGGLWAFRKSESVFADVI